MAKFELDNQMLIKLEKLCKLIIDRNAKMLDINGYYQLNEDRILIGVAFECEWVYPMWNYQRHLIQLTYADLDQAIKSLKKFTVYDDYEEVAKLDAQVILELHRLCRLILTLNTMELKAKGSYQLKSDRIIVAINVGAFPTWVFQQYLSKVTPAELNSAYEEISKIIQDDTK